MTETALQRKIVKHLHALGLFASKIHASRYGQAGWPDILAIMDGHAIFLEVKLPGGMPTPLQAAVIEKLRLAGATAYVVRSVDEAEQVVKLTRRRRSG
jgi:Holliday junction resolvase